MRLTLTHVVALEYKYRLVIAVVFALHCITPILFPLETKNLPFPENFPTISDGKPRGSIFTVLVMVLRVTVLVLCLETKTVQDTSC